MTASLINLTGNIAFLDHNVTGLFHAKTCDQPQDKAAPLAQRTCPFPEQQDATDLSCTLRQSAGNETVR